MKKIMSLLTIMAMISNTAFAGSVGENTDAHSKLIAKTFNEFRYKMTVEADPKDPNFQDKAVSDFKNKMEKLQAQGVTPVEIMEHMRSTLLDASARADFDRMMASIHTDKMSAEEAGNLVMKFMANRHQQGASYSGGQGSYKWVMIVLGVVIVGVVTYFVIKNQTKTDTKTDTATETNTNTETITDTDTETVTDTDTCTFTNTFTLIETVN